MPAPPHAPGGPGRIAHRCRAGEGALVADVGKTAFLLSLDPALSCRVWPVLPEAAPGFPPQHPRFPGRVQRVMLEPLRIRPLRRPSIPAVRMPARVELPRPDLPLRAFHVGEATIPPRRRPGPHLHFDNATRGRPSTARECESDRQPHIPAGARTQAVSLLADRLPALARPRPDRVWADRPSARPKVARTCPAPRGGRARWGCPEAQLRLAHPSPTQRAPRQPWP